MFLPNTSRCLFCTILQLFLLIKIRSIKSEEGLTDAALFEPSHPVRVLGPTSFPKPTDLLEPEGAVPIVKPVHGHHRKDVDAVFAYAEGYDLQYYLHFVETLMATNFTGDLVMAIAEKRLVQKYVLEYLTSVPNVVIYHSDMDCYASNHVTPEPRRVTNQGQMDIFQMCHIHEVYGWVDPNTGEVLRKADDPKEARVVATLRYDWYWIWLQNYQKNSWIMVLDARDSFFQSNPFHNLPRRSDPDLVSGHLYFFGENANATRLGKSTKK